MKKYRVRYRYSKDGKRWSSTSKTVEAETDYTAMLIIQSQNPFVEILEISHC